MLHHRPARARVRPARRNATIRRSCAIHGLHTRARGVTGLFPRSGHRWSWTPLTGDAFARAGRSPPPHRRSLAMCTEGRNQFELQLVLYLTKEANMTTIQPHVPWLRSRGNDIDPWPRYVNAVAGVWLF